MDQEQQGQERGGNSSNINTILIVVALVAAAIFAGWWFSARSQAPAEQNQEGIDVEITLPDEESPTNGDTEATE